jgi:asparagine synthase (glutamine-hydrolysing)
MLARDRMGVRPLFHTLHKGVFFFIRSEGIAPCPSRGDGPVALDQIFTLWAPIVPRTSFKGISATASHDRQAQRDRALLALELSDRDDQP